MIPQSQKDLKEYHGKLYVDPQRQQNMEYLSYLAKTDYHLRNNKKETEDYYKQSIMTAFDLAKWHDKNKVIQDVMMKCTLLARGRVLDFGGGIGTNCIIMYDYCEKNYIPLKIDYYDICEFCKGFAEWRFKKYNMTIINNPEEFAIKNAIAICDKLDHRNILYSTIYMIDVIGHIVDKKECLADLTNRLVTGGQLIMTNDAVESEEHPMHIAFDFDFDEYMDSINMYLESRQHLEVWRRRT